MMKREADYENPSKSETRRRMLKRRGGKREERGNIANGREEKNEI